jgi:hypothetical protein
MRWYLVSVFLQISFVISLNVQMPLISFFMVICSVNALYMCSKALIKILALTHELSSLLSFSCLLIFHYDRVKQNLITNYCKMYTILVFMKEDTLAAW